MLQCFAIESDIKHTVWSQTLMRELALNKANSELDGGWAMSIDMSCSYPHIHDQAVFYIAMLVMQGLNTSALHSGCLQRIHETTSDNLQASQVVAMAKDLLMYRLAYSGNDVLFRLSGELGPPVKVQMINTCILDTVDWEFMYSWYFHITNRFLTRETTA